MPAQEVTVDVNRTEPGTIEVPEGAIQTRDSFVLRLRNHGDPVHVHLRLGDALESVATLEEGNHYVPEADETVVPVAVEAIGDTVSGTIEVSARFGAQTASLPVAVLGGPRPVDVDERLSEPRRRDRGLERDSGDAEPPTPLESLSDAIERIGPGTVGLVALTVLAVAIVGTAAVVVDAGAAAIGILVVGAGILVALAVLRA